MNTALYPHKRIKHSTNEDLYNVLSELFGVSYSEGTMLRNNILIVMLFCSYVTAADLSYYLGMPENSFKSLHKQLNDLKNKGMINSINTGLKDGFSKSFYYPTETGFMTALSLLDNSDVASFKYKRRGKMITTMHDYSIGLNALHLMLNGVPFYWGKEVGYTNASTGSKNKGSLCVDGVALFNDGNKVFIEEDLGTETTGILIGKLDKYYSYELFDEPANHALIFSFRKPYILCEGDNFPAYSPKALLALLDTLDSYGITLLDYYNDLKSKQYLTDADKENISIIRHIGRIYNILDNKRDLTANVPYDTLYALYTNIMELRSDERVSELNVAHEEFTKNRMRSMAGLLCKKYRLSLAGALSEPYILSLLLGMGVYCISTNLLSNTLPYIFYNQSNMQYTMAGALNGIFDGISPKGYSPLLPFRLTTAAGIKDALILRNSIPFNNGYVCMEYLSKDLGAILRVKRYVELYLENKENVYVVCLVDNIKDALFYSSEDFLDCRGSTLSGRRPRLLFLNLSTITDDKVQLFTISSEGHVVMLNH